MATKVHISAATFVSFIRRNAFADIFNNDKSTGIISGNPSIAMSVALFFALEAIALIKVKVTENPVLPRNKAAKNCPVSFTSSPDTKLKAAQDRKLRSNNKSVL